MLLVLLADSPLPDPLGGWTQILLQAGAFGLLAYIVIVLAPRMLRETRLERESRDENFQRALNVMHDRFDSRNKSIVEAIEQQTSLITNELSKVCQGWRRP